MKIIITDLTRFQNPEIVCLAGIDPDSGKCIRPMLANGTKLDYFAFKSVKSHKVVPGSYLTGNFVPVDNPPRPHIEDCKSEGRVRVTGTASGADFQSVLEESSSRSIRKAFGARPDGRRYPIDQAPTISIVTLRIDDPGAQFRLIVDSKYGPPKFKAHVIDSDGFELSWLPVTDLGFSDHIVSVLAQDPTLSQLNAFLWSQKLLYLRLGLTREWGPSPDKTGYWVQLNGIYSFPSFRKDLRLYE